MAQGSITYNFELIDLFEGLDDLAWILSSNASPTNVVLFDILYEAHCLGHACLKSIITTINLLLVSIDDVIKRNKREAVILTTLTSNENDKHYNH